MHDPAPDGGAARFLVIGESDPLGATAINALAGLRDRMPELLASVGLDGAEYAFAGTPRSGSRWSRPRSTTSGG